MTRIHMALGLVLCALLAWGPTHAAPRSTESSGVTSAKTRGGAVRYAPIPSWVKDPGDVSESSLQGVSGPPSRREWLLDQQLRLEAQGPVAYMRTRRQALDSAGLKEVSEPAIDFNPAFQHLVVHKITLQRGKQVFDRTRDTRIEILRRERQLEQSVLNGQHTALMMLRDVRVGDIVDVAFSIVGANPIFGGRHASSHVLAGDAPIGKVHVRIDAPVSRKLYWRTLPQQMSVQHSTEGDRQIISLLINQAPPVQMETAIPPWVKVWPVLQVSEYGSWEDVERWAEDLFRTPPPTGEIAQRIAAWKARNLPREQLLAEVLRFVQDDIRYFSTSLGESSHRPAPPLRTLADRRGDCKDKTVLLNSLLTGLGFDAKPALVSIFRHRGIQQFLPSHEVFDHVVTAVNLDGQTILLDGTLTGQGLSWRERGFMDLGLALVVGNRKGLEAISPPPFALSQLQYQQDWDLSQPGQPTKMALTMTAQGLIAERWRQFLGNTSLDQVSQLMATSHVKTHPGLKQSGQVTVKDDRERNVVSLTMHFEHAAFGTYRSGGLDTEYLASEVLDHLLAPMEPRRKYPYWIAQSDPVEMRVVVRGPRPFVGTLPSPQIIQDRHFSFSTRIDAQGNNVTVTQRYERKQDEVQPALVTPFREAIIKARQLTGHRLRLLLIDRAELNAVAGRLDQERAALGDRRNDELSRQIQQQLFSRQAATLTLRAVPANSVLAQHILTERGEAHNMLEAPQQGLADANLVLQQEPQNAFALHTKGVALIGLKQPREAMSTFQRLREVHTDHPILQESLGWLGIAQLLTGDAPGATRTLTDLAQRTGGDQQSFALAWLYLAAEHQAREQGTQALSPYMSGQDRTRWPGILPHYLQGHASEAELMSLAKADPEQARIRLAEAHFFKGQKHLLAGNISNARKSFQLVLDLRALPHREHTLAALELQRLEGR